MGLLAALLFVPIASLMEVYSGRVYSLRCFAEHMEISLEMSSFTCRSPAVFTCFFGFPTCFATPHAEMERFGTPANKSAAPTIATAMSRPLGDGSVTSRSRDIASPPSRALLCKRFGRTGAGGPLGAASHWRADFVRRWFWSGWLRLLRTRPGSF